MRLTATLAVATTVVTFNTPLIAQTERELGSHEHGSASMNVAIDGDAVFVELESPWNNFVGFEYEPKSADEHALVDDAMAQLNAPSTLLSFVGTDCVVSEAVIDSGMADSDEHGDEHDDEHGDEHGKETHSSVLASYTFTCESIGDLSAIDVNILSIWTGFQELDVQLIGPAGQTLAEVTPEQQRLDITGIQ